MIKVLTQDGDNIIPMSEMKPLDIGRIIHSLYDKYEGKLVMRTASTTYFEVMDLANPGEDQCWSGGQSDIKVQLLNPGEKITLEVV